MERTLRARNSAEERSSPRLPQIPSVVQAVADDMRKRVLNGEFPPGAQLREVDLLEDYGISRHGIRSALHALAHDGLLRHQQHRGVFVPEANSAELADLIEARYAVESEAIRLIVEHDLDTDNISTALERLEAIPEDASWSDLLNADLDVHRAVVDAVRNLRISRFHDSLTAEAALFLAFHALKDDQRSRIRPTHRRMVMTILSGDVAKALTLLATDLREGLHLIDLQ